MKNAAIGKISNPKIRKMCLGKPCSPTSARVLKIRRGSEQIIELKTSNSIKQSPNSSQKEN